MKDSAKHPVEHSSTRAGGKEKGAGSEGLATAPKKRPTIVITKNLGLNPNSGDKAKKTNGRIAPDDNAGPPKIATVFDLQVKILTGDDGDMYYHFTAFDRSIIRSSRDVVESRLQVMAALRLIGILAVSSDIKTEISQRIEAAKFDSDAIVATRTGYEKSGSPRYFVYGDGAVICPDPKLKVVSLIQDHGRFKSKGDLSAYEEGIARVIRNQPVPITLFFYSLTQVLKPFVSSTRYKAENMIFELVGDTSTFKSALTCTLAGTVWGEGHSPEGYARSWNMSEQAIEDLLVSFNDHLLILDEATLAHTNEKLRAAKISDIVHKVSSGQSRARTGVIAGGHSVAMLSNSNQPMRSILAVTTTEEVRRALEVRLISFHLTQKNASFFQSVPNGHTSVHSAMGALFATTKDNFGLLARAYITSILAFALKDEKALVKSIEKSITKFLKKIDLDATDEISYRRAQPFALTYAAAVLAFQTGTLTRTHWGKVKRTILRAWRQYGFTANAVEGDARIVAYMRDTSKKFVDARDGTKPRILDKNFGLVAGIFYHGKDKALCLAVPNKAISAMRLSTAALKRLKAEGVLRAGKSLQTKLVLRSHKNEKRLDVYYVFKIPEIPSGTTLLRDSGNA